MLDPLTAIGLAGNIVQFVEFGAKLISTGQELHQSEDGALVKNLEIEAITLHLTGVVGKLSKTLLDSTGAQRRNVQQSSGERTLREIAESCESVARDLIRRLMSIKKQNNGHAWASLNQALRSIWTKDKIDSLLSRLTAIRDEIYFHLLSALSESQAKLAETLADIKTQNEAQKLKLGNLHKDLSKNNRDMKHDIITAIHDHSMRAGNDQHVYQVSTMLSQMADEDNITSIEQRLLHSLSFSRMRERRQRIAIAHEGTFEWVFDEATAGRKRWSNLDYWLAHQGGLYWINGKAGAGKSTFMKFLQGHPQTRRSLRQWAADSSLAIAGFYFWSPGTVMQKSQTGLLQSLLHEIFRQFPQLLPTILPSRWQSYKSFGADLHPWTLEELCEAFELIAAEGTRDHKFCFFIDGLDEFDGKHSDLVKVLKQLATVPSIKICVSSRPWNVFQDAFAHRPTLFLHDLTIRDIEYYVRAQFDESVYFKLLEEAEPQRAPRFISEIVDKSSGVFLWVQLVTRSLQEGLTDADQLEDLERRLEAIPADLEDYFMHILKGVDESHFRKQHSYFALCWIIHRHYHS